MDSNTHSTQPPDHQPVGSPDDLDALAADLDQLATRDLDRLPDAVRAQRIRRLQRLRDRLDGQWLKELAGVDARGAAGAEDGLQVGSTAGWLRNRLHLSDRAATSAVRTARALFRGPLQATAQAVCDGELSVAHAEVVAQGTQTLPDQVTVEAEPVLVEAARRLDPTRLRRLLGHLLQVADPDGADRDRERRHQRRGLWLAQPSTAWSRWMGCWNPRPARVSWPPWNPWPARPTPTMPAAAANATLMPWPSWPAAAWRVGGSPKWVGCGRS